MNKKQVIACLISLVISSLIHAASVAKLLPVNIDVSDQSKLQRGAKIFMNYCSGCHSLKYMRYNTMAKDLGLTTFTGEIDTDLLFNNLIFTTAKIHDPIEISMPAIDARQWFGIMPPDLSLTARERGASWIYTYLKSFYADDSKPFGTNNLLVPDVAMPNVLEPLIGRVAAVKGDTESAISHLVLVAPGEMNQREFNSTVEDLVTFLSYVAEPVQLVRYRIGIIVILFLSVFWLLAYLLKRTYWKNIH
ncbi:MULTISPECIES: cytochrome c1 [unclassified Legionella]|uniref:cytochrome c1 n=1 Tax=unclassified Legionella TaxID=2622702 RepID=UPI00105699C5|nr:MULTISPECIES: cytochrome c1 [unclassified Legionella]MDI9818428.1 cytochrome c1 [Legionella sp. PL877]